MKLNRLEVSGFRLTAGGGVWLTYLHDPIHHAGSDPISGPSTRDTAGKARGEEEGENENGRKKKGEGKL